MTIRQEEFECLFLDRTIKEIDASSINELVFRFTDGTQVRLETECMDSHYNLYGISIGEVKVL